MKIVVVGAGTFGLRVVQSLVEGGHEVSVVEKIQRYAWRYPKKLTP